MKTYNVHIYRAMHLFFPGIVASTAEEAATLAAEMPSEAALTALSTTIPQQAASKSKITGWSISTR